MSVMLILRGTGFAVKGHSVEARDCLPRQKEFCEDKQHRIHSLIQFPDLKVSQNFKKTPPFIFLVLI